MNWDFGPNLHLDFRHTFLLALAALSLFVRLGQPLPWSSLSLFQPLIVMAGLLVPTYLGDPALGLWIGWCLMLFFHVPAIYATKRISAAMAAMDADALESWTRVEPWLLWGMPGHFWQDMHLSYAYYLKEKPEEADKLIARWENNKGLPKAFKAIPLNYRIYGQAVLWKWPQVIDTYETLTRENPAVATSISFVASRAYLEQGEPLIAGKCLRQAHFDETIYPLDSLATNLLPFFALTGSLAQLEQIIRVLKKTEAKVPEQLINLWQARCLQTLGKWQEARLILQKALSETDVPLLKKRLETFLHKEENTEAATTGSAPAISSKSNPSSPEVKPEVKTESEDIWRLFKRAAFIQEILSPRRRSICVNVICLLCIFFFLSSVSFLIPLGLDFESPISPLVMGASHETVIVKGEYWRLLTYLFYHSDFLHIGSNLVGLFVFGRIAENIFGTKRFLAIYFVGGILSGISHVFLSDKLAVGASGAIQAIFAACAIGIFKMKTMLPPTLRTRYLSFMVGLTMFQVVLDQFVPMIAVFAHLGGLIAGLALGAVTAIREPDLGLDGEIDGTQKFI